MTPLDLGILLYLGELEELYMPTYLKKVDTDTCLISEVSVITKEFIKKMKEFKPVIAKEFIQNLRFDQHGNLYANIFIRNRHNANEACCDPQDPDEDDCPCSDENEDQHDRSEDGFHTPSEGAKTRYPMHSKDEDSHLDSDHQSTDEDSDYENEDVVPISKIPDDYEYITSDIPEKVMKSGYDTHTVLLNHHHRASRNYPTKAAELLSIKETVSGMFDLIKENIVENTVDQNPTDSIADLFSCLDLGSTEELESRIIKIRKLHNMYGRDEVHDVVKTNGNVYIWNKLQVRLMYIKLLKCSEEELVRDFRAAWQKLGILSARRDKLANKPTQHALLKKIIMNNNMVHP